ncbi:MAG: recombinase family protein [Shimia sp.]
MKAAKPALFDQPAETSVRAAVYARFSSDRQEMSSIDDQIAMTSACCEAQGWTVARTFADVAKSGRSLRRDGVQALLRAIEAGQVDVVVVEAVDRLTRRIADGLNTLDLFRHRSTRLISVTDGEQDFPTMPITAMGAQLAAQNIGVHAQRPLREGIERGRLVSKAYGYRAPDCETGLNRATHPEAAAVVRRIFEAFADGHAPDAIASDLNAEGIPSPTGGTWHGSTIRGNAGRGEGILRNRLYRGTATIGRTEKSYHPETGSKRVRPTPDRAVEVDIPELRIVPEPPWHAVQAELDRRAAQVHGKRNAVAARRTRSLLSGLLTCGCCRGSYMIRSRSSYGCHEAAKGACDGKRMISRRQLEARVLDRVRVAMRSGDVRAAFDAAPAAERAKLDAADIDGEMATAPTRRTEAKAKLDASLAAIEDGAPSAAFESRAETLAAEIAQADARIATLADRRAARDAAVPDADTVFDRALADMDRLLGDPDLVDRAHDHLATLIERITVHPVDDAPHGVRLEPRLSHGSILADPATLGATVVC